jgi:hypothetical protein
MSDHFKASRFARLFKKHTVEHYRSYLMSLVVLIGALSLTTGYILYLTNRPLNPEDQSIFFLFFMLAAGTMFTSTVFAQLGDKRKAIALLTLPASHFEKFLVAWIYSFIIFQVLFVATFYLVMPLMQGIFERAGQTVEIVNVFDPATKVYLVFVLYTFLHGVALAGSVYFEKLQFIKSAFALWLTYLALVLLNKLGLQAMFGKELRFMLPFGNVTFEENSNFFWIALPREQQFLLALIPPVLAIIFWLTAYSRLKEKQI